MKDRSALIVTLASAALIAGRLLAISRFDVNTSATILQVAGVGTAVAGTALTLLPVALVVTTCGVAVLAFVDQTLLRLPVKADLLLVFMASATLCLAPAELALVCAGIVLIIAGIGIAATKKGYAVDIRRTLAESRLLRVQTILLGIVIALAPIVLQRPWLPVQALSLRNGSTAVGYVLGESQGEVVVMYDQDRSIIFLNPVEIRHHEICAGPPRTAGAIRAVPQITVQRSVLGWLLWGNDVPRYPACPR
jgi:hypothetical protein